MKNNYVYYDANFDRIFLTDAYHHGAFGVWFYPAHNIYWIGML